ncbi:hypothetical protein BC828DRAFT_404554 [Blastocladiella britannica]|nr:hypothetical protein BC828DRAFT_404554 [Blastocladiella britannica]
MASYFDDHDLSDDESHPTPARVSRSTATATGPAQSLSTQSRTLLESFIRPPSPGAVEARLTTAPRPIDLQRLDDRLRPAVGMLDDLRLHTHNNRQVNFLESLIEELLASVSGPTGPPPTSKAFIAALPRPASVPKDATCPVCTDVLDPAASDLRSLPCNHIFDKECLVPWLQLRNTCPMCRHELPTDAPTPPPANGAAPLGGIFSALDFGGGEDDDQHPARPEGAGYSSYAGHGDGEDHGDGDTRRDFGDMYS